MQRKNYLLKKGSKRGGFALVMAVALLVILATIMAFSIQMTAKSQKRAVDIYVENQAILYAKNVAEYFVYKISQDKNCTTQKNFDININQSPKYHAKVKLFYIVSDMDNTHYCKQQSDLNLTAGHDEDPYAYVRIDVTMDVSDGNITSEPIRIFRRYVEDITPFVY